MKKIVFLTLLIIGIFVNNMHPQEVPIRGLQQISAPLVQEFIDFQASDKMRGRSAPSVEADKSAAYICPEQEANLTLKPVVKKKYDLRMDSRADITQTMNGMEVNVNTAYTANAVLEVKEVDPNGNFTVVSTWKDIETTSSVMDKDTTLRAENLQVVMETLFDKTGKVLKNVRTGQTDVKDLSNEEYQPIAIIEQLARNLKFPLLPAKATKTGEKWQIQTNDTVRTMELPMAMIVDTKEEYSFAGTVTENGIEYYKIYKSSPVKVLGDGTPKGMDMHMEGTGMNEGYSLLDKATLFPVRIEEKSGMDMRIMISGPQSMAIPITQNTATVIQFSETK